ncbi:LOW QUALITY PROTEIN: inositol 1,4,5-trisphosphate-gated calcium channel ITPR3-like [Ptychodera flava]|uniref:LOW QUALITY PROTEIN: inositol 1,4,5-trisphosphate-gated calcium channel ITPR3-like n=1 Tax=Ptychodera flava TaxID=63121 RepID=UPI00396A6BD8
MAEALSLGDIICLYSEEVYGYVFSQLSSCSHTALHVPFKQKKEKPNLPNPQVATFQVCIQNRYKAQKKYRKAKDHSDGDPNNLTKKNRASQLKIASDAEQNDNEQEQRRQHGKPVKYGQVIQLKHQFTGKYIHVSTTNTSATEYSNMLVEVLEFNAKNAQFKIMPRYKVKSEGDTVQVDDQIVLESFKSPGQYLHVSKAKFNDMSVNSSCFELNLSVRQSGFTLHRYDKPDLEHTDIIKAGSVFRLFHKELEAYLTAEGLFDSELSENVHLRVRLTDPNNPKTLFPSTSAIIYWQIEAEEGMMKGDTMRWEQQCRIRHFTTRKYLSITGKDTDMKVTLTDTASDPKTVFRMHPVIHDMDEMQFENYCRIEHVVTGCWLHGLSEIYQSNKSKVWHEAGKEAESMSGLQWDKAILKKVTASKAMLYDDAFTIQMVKKDLVEIFNFVSGMVPVLQKFIDDKKKGLVLNAKKVVEILNALQELKRFMIVKGEPVKARQKLLRNLKILELLVQICQLSYIGTSDERFAVQIIVECYNVMHTYVLGDSRKNELYIARFIDFFQTQIQREGDIGLHAAHMVMELFQDNRKIIDRLTRKQIDSFVDLLRKNKNYRYLDLLSVMCVCDGVAIPDNQTYITDVWLVKGKDGAQSCLYLTELGSKINKDADTVYVSTDKGKRWTPLQEFTADVNSEQFLFLDHQLDLFGKLCHGRNEFAIKVITEDLCYLTWEEAFNCLKDERLPDQLRAKYCALIISLFVDVGENHSFLERIKLSFKWDDIDHSRSSENIVPDGLLKEKYFPHLREWINKFLDKNTDMTASLIGHNMLVEQVLKLVHTLVKFGYYGSTDDIKKLLEPMMGLMDGRNDKPYPDNKQKGGQDAGQQVRDHYKKKQRFEQSPEAKAVVDAKYMAMEVVDLFFNFCFNTRIENFIASFKKLYSESHSIETRKSILFSGSELEVLLREDFEPHNEHKSQAKKAISILNEMFKDTSYFKGNDLTDILMDLSNYKYDKMVQESMHLLNRRYSTFSNLFTRAVQAQVLLTDKSVEILRDCERKLPIMRRLSETKMSKEQCETMGEILDMMIGFCSLENEPEERHPMNQTILYNFGILADIFDILSQEIDVRLMEQYAGLQEIFKKCFELLRVMARGNDIVQIRLYDRLDVLLNIKGAEAEMARALTEVFTGNKTTCLKIRDHNIQKIMQLVAQHLNEVPEFLELLNAIVKVEELNLPIKRNQSYVMKFFMQYRSEVAYVLDQPAESRERVLISEEGNKDLTYMVALVDLLATCAEGENRFIESICQTIFPIGELLAVLTTQQISDKVKKPFARFLLWVYMNTAGGMMDSGAEELSHDERFWSMLESQTDNINEMMDYMGRNPETVKQQLKKQPDKLDKSEEGKFHGSLHFLFDSIFPMLQVFFIQFYRIDKENYPAEPDKVDKLAQAMMGFVEAAHSLISNMTHMKTMVSATTALLANATLPVAEMEKFKEKYTHGGRSQDVRSDAQKDYEDYYRAEEELNDMLNLYAVNYKFSYGGENKVSTQLKLDYDNKREYTEMGGDEELPLGEEFQEHVKCFISKEEPEYDLMHFRKKKIDLTLSQYSSASKLVEELLISGNNPCGTERERLAQESLDVKCLQLLRALIHNEERKLPEDWLDDTKKHDDQLKKICDVQDELNSHGAMLKVLPLLARTSDSLAREVLAFLSTMLFSGNENVQKSLIEYFLSTREEHFFMALRNRMQLSAVATKEKRALQAQQKAKLDEVLQQQKSLNKAMRHGHLVQAIMATGSTIMKSGKFGSKFVNKRGGSRSKLGSQRSMKKQQLLRASHRSLRPKNKVYDSQNLALPPPSQPVASTPPNGRVREAWNPEGGIEMEVSFTGTSDRAPLINVEGEGDASTDLANLDIDDLPPEVQKLIEEAEADDLEFKDDGFIELVLRILGQMCDGQHKELQDYLREQPDNIKSVNLVAETAKLLDLIYANIDDTSIGLVDELFSTLNEFASGNHANSVVIFDNKIIEFTNYILRDSNLESRLINKSSIDQLKMSMANLIMSMIEENGPDWSTLALEVKETIDEEAIHSIMIEYYKKWKDADKDAKEDYTEVGFAYYHILCRLEDIDSSINKDNLIKAEDSDPNYETESKAWEFYSGNSLSIELLKDGEVQKVHFRVKDTSVLREEVKEKVKWNISRESPSDKITDFIDWSKDIMDDIRYQTDILSYRIAKFFLVLTPLWHWSLLLLSFTINIIIIVMWIAPEDSDVIKPEVRAAAWWTIHYVLGSVHNALSACLLISFFLSNHPRFPTSNGVKNFFKGVAGKEVHEERQSHLETKFFSFTTFYYLLFFGFSILGTIYWGYFFCFHLLHIAIMNQLLNRVLLAVTLNGLSLLWVFLFGVIIIYIYTVIGFAFLRSHFDNDNGLYCDTMFQCFVTCIRFGLIDGLQEHLTVPDEENTFTTYALRAIYDITYYIIIITIGLNIIFGIIVDTFSELRDAKWRTDEDMRTLCFVCGRGANEFERYGKGFRHHVKFEHNMWAYLFFFIHLDDTRSNDYTAIELYVSEMMEDQTYDFFPMNRALCLADEDEEYDTKIDLLMARVDQLIRRQNEEEKIRKKKEQKQYQEKKQEHWARLLQRSSSFHVKGMSGES